MTPKYQRELRASLAFLHDLVAVALTWLVSYSLRFNFSPSADGIEAMIGPLVVACFIYATLFVTLGLYRGLWRFASLADVRRIATAIGLGALIAPLAELMSRTGTNVPRSVHILQPMLLLLMMCGSRVAYRAWKEHRLYGPLRAMGEPVLVMGAGVAGARLVEELRRSRQYRIVGLLDDESSKRQAWIGDVRVLGSLAEVGRWAERYGVRQVILALPAQAHSVRSRAAHLCAAAGLKALTVPSSEELLRGTTRIDAVREIELLDLLGRDPVRLDDPGIQAWLGGRSVLVTGAGGSIGSELARQILRYRPSFLVLFDISEAALYRIGEDLRNEFPGLPFLELVGDVKDEVRVAEIMKRYQPSVIFHAAAYKHVPLMEELNAWQSIVNNALGTYVLAKTALVYGVEKFVLVSTDKAVNPTNVMGASKRLAELLCQSLSGGATRFVTVRFGNVIGSAGSVIPKFEEQIRRGGPVTVTHKDITRYFMSVEEATQLMLQAGCMGAGNEIFVLDMGEPVRIADLAQDMIQILASDPTAISVSVTGLRPGEKLFEETLAAAEHALPTPHPKLFIARAMSLDELSARALVLWLKQSDSLEADVLREEITRWVPEYVPAHLAAMAGGRAAIEQRTQMAMEAQAKLS